MHALFTVRAFYFDASIPQTSPRVPEDCCAPNARTGACTVDLTALVPGAAKRDTGERIRMSRAAQAMQSLIPDQNRSRISDCVFLRAARFDDHYTAADRCEMPLP